MQQPTEFRWVSREIIALTSVSHAKRHVGQIVYFCGRGKLLRRVCIVCYSSVGFPRFKERGMYPHRSVEPDNTPPAD